MPKTVTLVVPEGFPEGNWMQVGMSFASHWSMIFAPIWRICRFCKLSRFVSDVYVSAPLVFPSDPVVITAWRISKKLGSRPCAATSLSLAMRPGDAPVVVAV